MISPAPHVHDLPCSSCTWTPHLLRFKSSPAHSAHSAPPAPHVQKIYIYKISFLLLLFFYNYTSFFQVGVKKLWTGWIKMMEMISELRQNELVCREVQVMEKNGKQYIYYQNTFIYMRISDPNVLNKKDVYDIQCYQNKRKGGGC